MVRINGSSGNYQFIVREEHTVLKFGMGGDIMSMSNLFRNY
jgi:hypothetical protein